MNASGFVGSFYVITDWVMRVSIINMLWLVTNLPIILILFMMALSPQKSVVIVLAIPIALLLPFLFFPATIGAFATVRDWIMKIEQPSLLKGYWGHLKTNYKGSVLSGFFLTCIWIVWAADYYYLRSIHDLFVVILTIIGLLLFAFTINFFCLSVHYHMGKKELFKNAFFVTVGSPFLLIGVLLVNFLVVYLSSRFLFLLPFFTIALSIYLSFFLFYRFTFKLGK